jgi:hypothetical protein
MLHAWDKQDMHTGFWSENLKGRPLSKPRHRWKVNIKMDLTEIRCD